MRSIAATRVNIKALIVENEIVRYLFIQEKMTLLDSLRERDERIKEEREFANKLRRANRSPLLPELKGRNFADYLEPSVILAMNTSIRKSELLTLAWKQIDLENGVLTLLSAKAKSEECHHIQLNQETLSTLRKWREDNPTSQYLIAGEAGFSLTDIKQSWASVLEDAGIPNFRFHDLRHLDNWTWLTLT